MKLLDATDRGELWKALKAKFPPYQILPDTNLITYVKNNILASIYTVIKSAELQATSEEDTEIIMHLNIALERIWDLGNVGFFQYQAGERAALLNMGLTQVGWDEKLSGGSGNSFYKGNVTLRNIDPLKFMRDPFATSLETSQWCCTYDTFHKSVFLSDPRYVKNFKTYEGQTLQDLPENIINERIPKGSAKDYHSLIIFWIKDGKKVTEIHTIDIAHILHTIESVEPNEFPFAELYCNLPAGVLVGTSEPAKIFANNVALNLMDSIALTADYKNQRPPKFISSQSGLNIASFSKHGDEADRTFVVNGRASDAVHYHQFPQPSPALQQLKLTLVEGSQLVTGVDGRYTGRDTGSIITTGGTEEMLNRVTLIDTPKIVNYENYTKRLSHLILFNFIHHSPKRKFFYRKPNTTKWEALEVDFPKVNNDILIQYTMNISSQLPKNKQRVAAAANMLMERQMQYQPEVELITTEEWLQMQDLPFKERMLERMGLQRMQSYVEDVSQVIFQFGEMVRAGASPDDALLATAGSLRDKHAGVPTQQPPVPPVAGPEMPVMPQQQVPMGPEPEIPGMY